MTSPLFQKRSSRAHSGAEVCGSIRALAAEEPETAQNRPQRLSMSWSHIPYAAIVSYTSNIPENYIGISVGLQIILGLVLLKEGLDF